MTGEVLKENDKEDKYRWGLASELVKDNSKGDNDAKPFSIFDTCFCKFYLQYSFLINVVIGILLALIDPPWAEKHLNP